MAAETPIEPIHQFVLHNLFTFGTFGGDGTPGTGTEIAFTQSSLLMVLVVVFISGYLMLSTQGRGLVPNRWQLLSEMLYEFVADMVRSSAGNDGMKFFPFVFSIFTFLLFANWAGLLPFSYTVTSQVVVTSAMALMVFLTVVIYGFMRNGLGFLKLFVPAGIPWYVMWLVVPIEFVSFLSRPVSHSLRLWGNMLAGHIVLKVFGGMVVALSGLGALGILGAVLPLVMAIALTGLEILIAALQAFVFAVLTCVYLNDTFHPSH